MSGSQAPGAIKEGGSHSRYWATSEGGPSRGFPLAAIFGVAAGLFSVFERSHNILLSRFKVIQQCLLRGPEAG